MVPFASVIEAKTLMCSSNLLPDRKIHIMIINLRQFDNSCPSEDSICLLKQKARPLQQTVLPCAGSLSEKLHTDQLFTNTAGGNRNMGYLEAEKGKMSNVFIFNSIMVHGSISFFI